MRIYLSQADRERYGAPEVLPLKATFGLREAAAMKVATKWTVDRLIEAWQPQPSVDEDGNVRTKPALDEAGQPLLDDVGQPKVEPVMERNLEAIAVLVWVALRRAGIHVPWNDSFDISTSTRILEDEDEDEEAGKAPEATEPTIS